MADVKEKGKLRLNTVNPNSLEFGLFSSEEILQLSVAKIFTSQTFDVLGHPISGGLYDPLLGPIDKLSSCATCLNNIFMCPGHFGHIDLPLPVINPFFSKVVIKILGLSCLKCHNIVIPYRNKFILINQLRLLADSNINEALQFETYFNKQEGVPADFNREVYDDMIKKLNGNHTNKVVENNGVLQSNVIESKSIHLIRESFVTAALKLVSKSTCPNCYTRVQKVRMYQKQIITNVKVEVAQKFKEVGDRSNSLSVGGQTFIMPSETLVHLRKIWRNDSVFLSELFPVFKTTSIKHPTDLLFITAVLVPPSNVRPANYLRGTVSEHLQNNLYKAIIDDSFVVRTLVSLMKDNGSIVSDDCKLMISKIQGSSYPEKLQFAWHTLQMDCELLVSQDLKNKRSSDSNGLKQILEKKEGIIRMHMMGKRVNFAARSVITPDPNLNIDEIGIPEEFAKKLTYPVPVTPWNVKILRKMVINGPDVHPGATIVELEDGSRIRISSDNSTQRESIANQLLTPGGNSNDKTAGIKTLHRHLINGDVLLMNRQPTLHKPSIMAHRARVLKGEKTIRLHYSNCKSYNADFDGDEMNAHFPQNELARSEGYNIVSVCNQYLVPKDGTPLGGLIQDHMVSGVRLSVRGRFFTRDDYMQLVFQALPYVHGDIKILPPAIIKPVKLWSGKQIISTVILNIIPRGKNPINLISTAKINSKAWIQGKERKWKAGGTPFGNPNTMSEAEVIIRNGELLCGVLDKTHYGSTPYSLIHCVYELYGGECSCKLLSAFGKLFAAFLQTEGFTLGVKDILVTKQADKERLVYMKAIKKIGNEAATKALDLPLDTDKEVLKFKLEEAYRKDPKFRQTIDRQYKNSLDSFTNKINTACVPNGLIERFPYNNLQLMVQSGAKGSTVNTMQISCLLGQIELEGKRPPLMISGRSLPSFVPFETTARSGGFIDGRFMTGIQPQEFFFHCMAGREGLIDTAVKTSRSGYLQRCLIKHLEGISVKYDMTVRDSDGSVVQYLYGEDGMDVPKAQFFKESQIPFLVANSQVIINEDALSKLQDNTVKDGVRKYHKKMKSWNKCCQELPVPIKKLTPFDLYCMDMKENVSSLSNKVSKKTGRSKKAIELCKKWVKLDEEVKSAYYKKCKKHPDPLISQYQSDRDFGVISERLDSLMDDYLRKRGGNVSSNHKKRLQDMINFKSMTSMCSPGEPVGILAAQSIGEPSTQMTLNTFHFAGRGEMNVTLGIPRLREILMMASKTIKTPSVEVPFKRNIPRLEKVADRLRKSLTRITLADVLEFASVTERQILEEPNRRQLYDIYFKLLPSKAYSADTHIKSRHILEHIENVFLKELIKRGPTKRDSLITEGLTKDKKSRSKKNEEDDPRINEELDDDPSPQEMRKRAESESSEEEFEADDEDATATKMRARRVEEQEYQEKEDEDEDEIKDDTDLYGEIQEDDESDKEDNAEIDKKEESRRTEFVIESNESVENYRFDTENQMWCEVTLSYPHYVGRIDFATVLRERAAASVIHEVPGIRRAFVYESDDRLMLKTDGHNFPEIFRHDDILDINRLYSNDIHGIAETYGIEAAAKIIVKEVQEVFKVYGIAVDPRHLLLVADYMTFDGTIQPLNRTGIMGNVSSLQQMSFESSSAFLKAAVLLGKRDNLNSPSSCLFVGQPCKVGTGIVDCRLSSSIFLST